VRCTACGSEDLSTFYRVSDIPIHSCRMMPSREAALAFPRGDLALAFCAGCGFIQNTLFDPELQDYGAGYEDSQIGSPTFRAYLQDLADELIDRHGLRGTEVLEIGAGAGDFLVMLAERGGCRGIGIGPSSREERLAPGARGRVRLITERLGPAHYDLPADFVCSRHTPEHIDAPAHFVRHLQALLRHRPDVPVFIEVPDATRILDEGAFWDVYYEHCGYFTPGSLARLFRRHGFAVTRLASVYDRQYLTLEAALGSAVPRPAPPLELEDEPARIAAAVRRFEVQVTERLEVLARQLEEWRTAGRRVVVWGASSKAVAYLTALSAGDRVAAVVDINPAKRGLYLAGTGHKVLDPDDLVDLRPDVALLTNAIYRDEIARDLAVRGLHPELAVL
jgi:SAM-dependent methyltransferase